MSLEQYNQTEKQESRRLTPAQQRQLKRQSVKARLRRKRWLTFVVVVLLVGLVSVPFYQMVYQPYRARGVYRNMKNLYGQSGSGAMDKALNDEQLGALYDVNTDIGGWLIVPETDINLPVVQPKKQDSIYYSNHLFDGTQNSFGTPYYLTETVAGTAGTNTVIRGGKELMGQLGSYKNLQFYQSAPVIFLDTLQKAYSYKIFAIVELEDQEVADFSKGTFASEGAFHTFVSQMSQRSFISTGIMVNKTDSLLTLICDTDHGKLAVIGRAVRENEDFTVDTAAADYNGSNGMSAVGWSVTKEDFVTNTDWVKEELASLAKTEETVEDVQ